MCSLYTVPVKRGNVTLCTSCGAAVSASTRPEGEGCTQGSTPGSYLAMLELNLAMLELHLAMLGPHLAMSEPHLAMLGLYLAMVGSHLAMLGSHLA